MKQHKNAFCVIASSVAIIIAMTGCGAVKAAPSATDNPKDTASASSSTQKVDSTSSEIASESANSESQKVTCFKAGVWLAHNNDSIPQTTRYWFFDAAGTSGRTAALQNGMGIAFAYEIKNQKVTFHMGDAEDNTRGRITSETDTQVEITWNDGTKETLTYVSDADSDTFQFYDDDTLCEKAAAYYRAHNKELSQMVEIHAAVTDNLDGTAAIELYLLDGERADALARYTVDRQTASGKDDISGTAVALS